MPELDIEGGCPTFPAGPPPWPMADESVQQALLAAYSDGSWGKYHGPNCRQLKEQLSEFHQSEFVHLCCSGTIGVELALRGLGVGPGDEVILGGYDFSGNFRCVEAVGARPVLVDVHPHTACLDEEKLPATAGSNVRAVIASHLHSCLARMDAIVDWARSDGVAVIEDACQAPGATVQGKMAGTWGDAAVLSFGGSKLVTSGRGGAVITQRPEVHQRIKAFAEQGNDAFPLSELQAAVLIPQIEKLDSRNQKRRRSVRVLGDQLHDTAEVTLLNDSSAIDLPSYFKVALLLGRNSSPRTPRETFITAIKQEGLAVDAGFRGFWRRSDRRCRREGQLENSRFLSEQLVVLHHPILLQPDDVIQRAAAAVCKVISRLPEASHFPD